MKSTHSSSIASLLVFAIAPLTLVRTPVSNLRAPSMLCRLGVAAIFTFGASTGCFGQDNFAQRARELIQQAAL